MPPGPSKLDAFKPVIDEILRADLDTPRKQRHTVKRIYDGLITEHDMHDVSCAVVLAYVADRKPKIPVEAGRGPVNVFSRRPTGRAQRPRSTSVRSRSTRAGNWRPACWSRSGFPSRVGRQVRVHLHASHLVVYDGRTEVARHERLMAESGTRLDLDLDLDHYPEALLRKTWRRRW